MLFVVVVAMFGVGMYRQSRRNVMTTFTSSEDFSVRTIFLNAKKGEADLFVGYLIGMIAFSLFVAGLIRFVESSLS